MTLTSHEENQQPSSYCIQVRAKKSRNIIAAHLVYLISSLPSCLGSGYSVPDLAPPEEVDRTYVNIREFMRPHSQYIWTTLGTLRDECVTCKVEKVLNVTNLTVEFLRYHNVDHLRVRRHYKGNFGFKQQIPILMELTVIKEEIIINNTKWTVPLKLEGHTEVLIYAEANQSCGVFLNKARTFSTLPNGDVHMFISAEMFFLIKPGLYGDKNTLDVTETQQLSWLTTSQSLVSSHQRRRLHLM